MLKPKDLKNLSDTLRKYIKEGEISLLMFGERKLLCTHIASVILFDGKDYNESRNDLYDLVNNSKYLTITNDSDMTLKRHLFKIDTQNGLRLIKANPEQSKKYFEKYISTPNSFKVKYL